MTKLTRSYWTLIFSLLSSFLLHAPLSAMLPPQDLTLEAQSAQYVGDQLHLSGQVQLKHSIGTLVAKYAKVIPLTEKGLNGPYNLELTEEVILELSRGGKLSCDFLLLNNQELTASFYDNEAIYIEMPTQNEQLQLWAKKGILHLSEQTQQIKDLNLEGNVNGYWGEKLRFKGDHASWQGFDNSREGLLKLDSKKHLCELIYKNEGVIKVPQLEFDTRSDSLQLFDIQGHFFANQTHQYQLQSPKGLWNLKTQTLQLDEKTLLQSNLLGKLYHQGPLTLSQKEPQSPYSFDQLYAEGRTQLYTTHKGDNYSLLSPGHLEGDLNVGRLQFFSKTNNNNHLEEQVFVKGPDHELRGQSALLLLDPQADLSPRDVYVYGSVSALSHYNETDNSHHRFALADNLHYDFSNAELLLSSSSKEKPVLYVDADKPLQMSAKQLYYTPGGLEHEANVQGSGHVRFTFSDEESRRIADVFAQRSVIKIPSFLPHSKDEGKTRKAS